jgi:hypothetical protein
MGTCASKDDTITFKEISNHSKYCSKETQEWKEEDLVAKIVWLNQNEINT